MSRGQPLDRAPHAALQLGSRFGPWIERRFFQSEKGAKQRDWAVRSLERYGIPLIIACRFIPVGRTAVMLSCGIVRYDRRRFIIATAIAGVIWACYSFFLGRLGGKAFEDKPWAGLLIAFGGTLAVSGLIELVRRLRARRARRLAEEQGQAGQEMQMIGVIWHILEAETHNAEHPGKIADYAGAVDFLVDLRTTDQGFTADVTAQSKFDA